MYKKLSNSSLPSCFFKTFIFAFASICFSLLLGIYFFVPSDFVLNFYFDKNSFLFSSLETAPTINTEILARRLGSGLATAGLGGVGTGIGLVFSGLIKGFSRNPSLKDDLFSYAIFGFALTEAIGLFALMMAFMLLYA